MLNRKKAAHVLDEWWGLDDVEYDWTEVLDKLETCVPTSNTYPENWASTLPVLSGDHIDRNVITEWLESKIRTWGGTEIAPAHLTCPQP